MQSTTVSRDAIGILDFKPTDVTCEDLTVDGVLIGVDATREVMD